MGVDRTVFTILVLGFIQCINCDSVREYDTDGMSNVDQLLRGSNDGRVPSLPDFDEDDPSRNIEPEKVFDLESKEDREYDVEIVNPTAIDQRDVTRTTEVYLTTEAEAIPEALGLRNESNTDTQSSVETNDYNKMESDRRDVANETELNDSPDTKTYETTEMPDTSTTIDNNVYRKPTEDVHSSRDNNVPVSNLHYRLAKQSLKEIKRVMRILIDV